MIVYRKAAHLRTRRAPAPEPPWWFATAVAPYGGRGATPLAVDYLDLTATGAERAEVTVGDRVRDEMERLASRLAAPVLVDATHFAEVVFRRGAEAASVLAEREVPATVLISTRSVAPEHAEVVALAAWPVEPDRIERHAASLQGRHWGMVVPVVFPATTDLATLDRLAQLAASHGARFFAAVPLIVDAAARQAIATTLLADEETYHQLFHMDLEPLVVATERHVAALAAAAGMADFVLPPRWNEKSNWNAAVLLTLLATRMLAMEVDPELAGTIARSARFVAELEKPLARIAEAASLSIVEALDEVSVEVLTEWLEGKPPAFAERIHDRWRLRRDAGMVEPTRDGE